MIWLKKEDVRGAWKSYIPAALWKDGSAAADAARLAHAWKTNVPAAEMEILAKLRLKGGEWKAAPTQ